MGAFSPKCKVLQEIHNQRRDQEDGSCVKAHKRSARSGTFQGIGSETRIGVVGLGRWLLAPGDCANAVSLEAAIQGAPIQSEQSCGCHLVSPCSPEDFGDVLSL